MVDDSKKIYIKRFLEITGNLTPAQITTWLQPPYYRVAEAQYDTGKKVIEEILCREMSNEEYLMTLTLSTKRSPSEITSGAVKK